MKNILGKLFAVATLGIGSPCGAQITTYTNAKVWNGDRFVAKAFAVEGSQFVAAPRAPGNVVDLTGSFVIPGMANAHEHRTNSNWDENWAYLEEGIFYVWNPNSIILDDEARGFFDQPKTIDVRYSMGGITEPGGHPQTLYTGILTQYVYKGMTLQDFIGNAFHYGRTHAEIDHALDLLKAQHADFVKAYLLFSEDYVARRNDPKFEGLRGLNPANMPYLVAAARRRGLPTYVHVETRADLMVAVRAGATFAGHLPAYRDVDTASELALMALTAADAREIARRKMMVIPTYGLAQESFTAAVGKPGFDPAQRDRVYAVQGQNIRRLVQAGVVFLTGTDRNPSIVDEIKHWVSVGGMTQTQALKFALASGRRMEPRRRIGCFNTGCEADFLVLAKDPTLNLESLRSITKIVKGGLEVTRPSPAEGPK